MLISLLVFVGWLLLLGIVILLVLMVKTLRNEGETKKIQGLLFPIIPILIVSSAILIFDFPFKAYLLGFGELIVVIIFLLLVIPNGEFVTQDKPSDTGQLDERDIMFARATYQQESENYKDYYSRNPEQKEMDDNIRSMPNLCSPGTFTYNPLNAAVADAAFTFLGDIRHLAEGEINKQKLEVEPEKMSCRLKGLAQYYGAKLVGITELKPYHYYSHRGRHPEVYGEKIDKHNRYAIVFAVEMDYEIMKGAPQIQVVAESSRQYIEGAKIGMVLAYYIRQLGYNARNHMDGNYLVIAPLLAQDAGLGEIGRMGILVTEEFGPRVRLGVVTTDLSLIQDKPVEFGVQNFCTICKKCAQTCPSQAIPHGDKEKIGKVRRWKINQESCYTFWRRAGTDCGICMSTCPYSKPNTILHKFARFSIKRSQFARKIFLFLDDYIYGKRPLSLKKPKWMNV